MYHTEPPTDKTIREWYMNFSRVADCALRNEQAVRAYGPGRPGVENWLRRGTSAGLLYTRQSTLNVSRIKGISSLAEELLASQE